MSINPQVEAFTNRLSDLPRWLAQSAIEIFSAISRSRVSASGVRSKASARHMSARPSRVPSENSLRKLSTTPCLRAEVRAPETSSAARSTTACLASAASGSLASNPAMTSASSANFPASSSSQFCSVFIPLVLQEGLQLPGQANFDWRECASYFCIAFGIDRAIIGA